METHNINDEILALDAGTISYRRGLEIQEELFQRVSEKKSFGYILIMEHFATLTLGKHADKMNILTDSNELAKRNIDIQKTDRGGEVTAHMPGQLVIYPIINLKVRPYGPKKFVNEVLLKAVQATLAHFSISSAIESGRPGVWVDNKKICAVGVRIKQHTSTHGIALNVNNELNVYDNIVPCGITDGGVTSMAVECNQPISLDMVRRIILEQLGKALNSKVRVESVDTIIKMQKNLSTAPGE